MELTSARRANYRVQKARTVKFLDTGQGNHQYRTLEELDAAFFSPQPANQQLLQQPHTFLSPTLQNLNLDDTTSFTTWELDAGNAQD